MPTTHVKAIVYPKSSIHSQFKEAVAEEIAHVVPFYYGTRRRPHGEIREEALPTARVSSECIVFRIRSLESLFLGKPWGVRLFGKVDRVSPYYSGAEKRLRAAGSPLPCRLPISRGRASPRATCRVQARAL